ncbi:MULTISPECIES: hypothetical protein [Pseudomonas]|jgi:hypothetical protein|uniref:hypothetical protein n=1 Tax=Pseudomonas TaxID=286 RepID=UPI0012FE0890|nr:hypothetical protein [Pseudomonas sp. Z003-0.4C(8344-21)]
MGAPVASASPRAKAIRSENRETRSVLVEPNRHERKSQIAGKKNPKQLMEAWDLKMHKPWW